VTQSPTCTTDADVRAAFGTVCTVIGTYDLQDITNAKGAVMKSWPVVRLEGGGRAVLIESVWDDSKRPDDATIAAHRGKKVAVTGPLHAQPPAPGRAANMAMPCISPVETLRLLP